MKKPSVFIFILFIIQMHSISADAEQVHRIILLNTELSVEKYRIVQYEFGKYFDYRTVRVDMGDQNTTETELNEIIDHYNPPLIFCIGSKAYATADRFYKDNAILFSSIINWMRLPPRPKTYGISYELHTGMQITLFRYIFPKIKNIGLLYSSNYNQEWYDNAVKETQEMDVSLKGQAISDPRRVAGELKSLIKEVDAFWLISDPVVISEKKILLEMLSICDERKIPVFSYSPAFSKFGAMLVVSPDDSTIGRQAADMAEQVLENKEPAEKVQYPMGTYMIMNLKKAKQYGLTYSEESLSAVNEIIE